MSAFSGKTVILSGAAGGFGRRTAERLHDGGANLVLSDLAKDPGEAVVGFDPKRVAYEPGDIAREETGARLVAVALARFGALDIAINNAGIVHQPVPMHLVSAADARRVIEVDLLGVFFAMQHQIATMTKRFATSGDAGIIVNIASIAGTTGAPTLSAYAAAKHGVVGLTRTAAAEYARHGVRINAVCPSFARTNMAIQEIMQSAKEPSAAEARMVRGVPMRRLAEIDEVVEAILFAASPANSFMTGETIGVDGGIGAV
ncbi:SDR family NAD(P)-dependent oxidoreductase [Oricola sp.]|uniref:SDR family NAD(P)-dependent oxidoreductase n=1 Tax=Oricola sp. TaxID=1979950 RepID=UPI003BA8A1FC